MLRLGAFLLMLHTFIERSRATIQGGNRVLQLDTKGYQIEGFLLASR